MPRKAKKKMHRMPPLSFVDKLIYWTIFLVLLASYALLLLGPLSLRNQISFADTAVVAAAARASMGWLFVPWFAWFIMTFILWAQPYQNRKPIFGLRKFKYGPPAWPKEYPLFMKNKPPVFVSERKQQERRRLALILAVVLVVSFIPFPWSLYGRNCLRNDGSIVQHNIFNVQTREFTPKDISELKIDVFRHSTRHGPTHWDVQMVFTAESGRKFTFDFRDFRDDWLRTMLDIKALYDPSIICYEDVEDLDRVAIDNNMSPEETELLYQLFGQ